MKSKLFSVFTLLTFVLIFSYTAQAQKVFSADYKSNADITVFVVDYKSNADLVVYKCDYSSSATGNDGLWYFEDYKSNADKVIFFVDYASNADLKIYFAEYKSNAGWKNKAKQHLMY